LKALLSVERELWQPVVSWSGLAPVAASQRTATGRFSALGDVFEPPAFGLV
jgi:hypothetical protein